MAMAGPIRMITDPGESRALMTLAQWFSPAFPIGAFSYSHGLEWLVETDEIDDAAGFRNWLTDILQHGAGHNDLMLLAAAYGAETPEALDEIDSLARALAPSSERLLETTDMGGSFVRTVNAVWGCNLPELCYPVAAGAAARACDLPLGATARLYLHALAGSLTSAAIRLVPLGQTEGQACLHHLLPLCDTLCSALPERPLDALGASAIFSDIASMNHEIQYSRMFRS